MNNFLITNHQNYTFSGFISDKFYHAKSLAALGNPNINLIFKVVFVWSIIHPEEQTPEEKLSIELKKIDNGSNQTRSFALCERQVDGVNRTFIVFGDKTNQRENSLFSGLFFSGIGCALAATGFGIPAAIALGAGSSVFFDAYKNDELDFNSNENFNQAIIGGAIGFLTGGLGNVAKVGKTAHVLTQLGASSATNTIGYIAGEKLNGREVKPQGIVVAAVTGFCAGAAGKAAAGVVAGKVADQADDILLKAFTEGATAGSTAHVMGNAINGRPITEGLLTSGLFGGVTAASYAVPEAISTRPNFKPQENNPASATIKNPSISMQNKDSNPTLNTPQYVIDKIETFITSRCRVFWNGKWEKFQKNVDKGYFTEQILSYVANGQTITFKDSNGNTYTLTSDSSSVNNLLNEKYKFWDFDTNQWGLPPRRDIPYHSDRLSNRLDSGKTVYFGNGKKNTYIIPLKKELSSQPNTPPPQSAFSVQNESKEQLNQPREYSPQLNQPPLQSVLSVAGQPDALKEPLNLPRGHLSQPNQLPLLPADQPPQYYAISQQSSSSSSSSSDKESPVQPAKPADQPAQHRAILQQDNASSASSSVEEPPLEPAKILPQQIISSSSSSSSEEIGPVAFNVPIAATYPATSISLAEKYSKNQIAIKSLETQLSELNGKIKNSHHRGFKSRLITQKQKVEQEIGELILDSIRIKSLISKK